MNEQEAQRKGRLVEEIIARLHELPGLEIATNVRLPSLRGGGSREIDLVLSGAVAGYPMRIAFECKNYAVRVGVQCIDEFIGKLLDVGIPPQLGIFVCVKGYTSGALRRAESAGVRALILGGLDKIRLEAIVYNAFQGMICLLPVVAELTFTNDVGVSIPASNLAMFYHEDGRVFAFPDLIWHRWCVGEYPQAIGRHEIKVQIPEGFQQRFEGRRVTLMGIKAIWHVVGLVVRMPGLGTLFSLTNVGTGALEKLHASVKFDTGLANYPVHVFADEGDLQEFLDHRPEEFKLTVVRFRMRRIRMMHGPWPPGQKTMERFHRFIEEHPETTEEIIAGKRFMSDFEGPEALWDDIWQGRPRASPQHTQRRDDDTG